MILFNWQHRHLVLPTSICLQLVRNIAMIRKAKLTRGSFSKLYPVKLLIFVDVFYVQEAMCKYMRRYEVSDYLDIAT